GPCGGSRGTGSAGGTIADEHRGVGIEFREMETAGGRPEPFGLHGLVAGLGRVGVADDGGSGAGGIGELSHEKSVELVSEQIGGKCATEASLGLPERPSATKTGGTESPDKLEFSSAQPSGLESGIGLEVVVDDITNIL